MIIYKITNLINNKTYVGLDRNKNNSRWKQHKRRSKESNPIQLIDRKIKQYGLQNFQYIILEKCNSIQELKNREIYYIKIHNSFVGNGEGYNLTYGGDGCQGFKMTQEQIAKNSGKNHYFFGKKRSKTEKLQISIAMKGKNVGDKNPFKLLSVRKKISEYAKKRIGKLNSNFKHDISYKDLYDYYIVQNHNLNETVKHFKCSEATLIRNLKKLGISKHVTI